VHLPTVQLHHAASLEDAVALMDRYGPRAEFLAGGTDILVDLKTSRTSTDHLISISGIDQAHGIDHSGSGLTIGSLVTIAELNESDLAGPWSAIQDATSVMAAPAIRNMATVGGNLASAVPCADLPPILMALDARLDLWSPSGIRNIAVADFFTGPRSTVREHNEVLLSIKVPQPERRSGAAYVRFALREGNAIAVASAAAFIHLNHSGGIDSAALAIGAVAPAPLLVRDAASLLVGEAPNEILWAEAADAAIRASEPISDIRASAEFRKELTGVLATRALRLATDRAGEAPS
jgi:carbon-monoxide dehydrogenase medium subunit